MKQAEAVGSKLCSLAMRIFCEIQRKLSPGNTETPQSSSDCWGSGTKVLILGSPPLRGQFEVDC